MTEDQFLDIIPWHYLYKFLVILIILTFYLTKCIILWHNFCHAITQLHNIVVCLGTFGIVDYTNYDDMKYAVSH